MSGAPAITLTADVRMAIASYMEGRATVSVAAVLDHVKDRFPDREIPAQGVIDRTLTEAAIRRIPVDNSSR